jgi:hypothetical protein
MRKTLPLFSLLSFFLIASSLALLAQNPTGSLKGDVLDASGARIPSAKVVVERSGFLRNAAADKDGEFRIDNLPPGTYELTVNAPGFVAAKSDVVVTVSAVLGTHVTLKPEGSQATVNVQAEGSSVTTQPIDLVSVVHQGIVTSQDLQNLPLAARSFANIAYLAPGTEPVEPSDPTKARITAVSTGGSSGLNNELTVDGGDNSDDWIGGFLQNFSPDSIQEFSMRTAQTDADTGGTTAGSVVIITRRGTNDWHGSAAFYDRAASLNARFPIENPEPDPKQPFSRQNYVFTLGGPIKRDRIWFFSSLEYVHENASIAYSPASTAEFNALAQLASAGLVPGGVTSIPVPSSVPVPFRDYIGNLRFDWAQSQQSEWFLRTSLDTYTTHNNLVQQATLPSTGLLTHNNYFNTVVSNTYSFGPNWLGTFVFDASLLHLTQTRNSKLGFALQFPFSLTSLTVSGFETFGDNQFATPITAFPVVRNQEKYQFRYDIAHNMGNHSIKFGINFIHEPVLGGELSSNQETLYALPNDPSFYTANAANLAQFPIDLAAGASTTPAGDGDFSQNLQRLAFYAQDSWRLTPHFTLNYGLRYQTSFGLFIASGRDQSQNPVYATLPLNGVSQAIPHDYRKAFAPRLGIAYAPGNSGKTVFRAGFGMFYNDLTQVGWATAFQAVNGGVNNSPPAYIDPNYKTPYAIHVTAGGQHAFNDHWTVSADYTHEQGNHGYRGYGFDQFNLFKSDNRSSYNALMLKVQGNLSSRFNLVAHYTLAQAQTWGCILGELFDYVNGVCDPFHAFAPGDYGPSGEDVRNRFVVAGNVHAPAGIEVSTLFQAESARPYTITNADSSGRIAVNGVPTSLDQFRGTPYIQMDLRVSRPFKVKDRVTIMPFAEFFNLFNRNNPGANFVANVAALTNVPVDQQQSGNITSVCANADCSVTTPLTSLKQIEIPAGGLGDFFGPGTTVGIPFAAQLGVRVTF